MLSYMIDPTQATPGYEGPECFLIFPITRFIRLNQVFPLLYIRRLLLELISLDGIRHTQCSRDYYISDQWLTGLPCLKRDFLSLP